MEGLLGDIECFDPTQTAKDCALSCANPLNWFRGPSVKNIKAKEMRGRNRRETNKKKHGDENWEEPASEGYVKWHAKRLEKSKEKDARRKAHDAKQTRNDRTEQEIHEDYQ